MGPITTHGLSRNPVLHFKPKVDQVKRVDSIGALQVYIPFLHLTGRRVVRWVVVSDWSGSGGS